MIVVQMFRVFFHLLLLCFIFIQKMPCTSVYYLVERMSNNRELTHATPKHIQSIEKRRKKKELWSSCLLNRHPVHISLYTKIYVYIYVYILPKAQSHRHLLSALQLDKRHFFGRHSVVVLYGCFCAFVRSFSFDLLADEIVSMIAFFALCRVKFELNENFRITIKRKRIR